MNRLQKKRDVGLVGLVAASGLVFLYLFNVPLFSSGSSFLRSSYLAIGIALLYLLFRPRALSFVKKITLFKNFTASVTLAVLLLAYTWMHYLMRGAGDASFPLMITRSVVWIVGSVIVYAVIKDLYPNHLINVLIAAFVVQSVVIDLSIVSSDFRVFTDQFRSDGIVLRGQRYGGYRGLAIAGSSFYGLAICYAMLIFLIAIFWDKWRLSSVFLKIILVIIIAIAAMSAGRTTLVGVVAACIVAIGRMSLGIKTTDVSRVVILGPITIIFIVCIVHFVLPGISSIQAVSGLMRFVSSAFTDFGYGGNGLGSSSAFSFLDMYFPLSPEQLLVGDGLYTVNGHYYMHTDVGYMRPVLFFGAFGFLLMIAAQLALLSSCETATNKSVLGCVFVLLLIFQLKGEAILVASSLSVITQMVAMELGVEESLLPIKTEKEDVEGATVPKG